MYLRNSLPCTSSIPCYILAICQAYVIYQVKLKFDWIFFFLKYSHYFPLIPPFVFCAHYPGVAFTKLNKHPELYPLVSSTAAKSSIRMIHSTSHSVNLMHHCLVSLQNQFQVSRYSLHLTLASLSGVSTESISGRLL